MKNLTLIIIAIPLVFHTKAQMPYYGNNDIRKNTFHIGIGMSPVPVGTVGFTMKDDKHFTNHNLQYHIGNITPVFGEFTEKINKNWCQYMGASFFSLNKAFKLGHDISVNVKKSTTVLGRTAGLSSSFNMYPGYYGKKFFMAAQLGIEYYWAVHIKHSAIQKDIFNDIPNTPYPKDGWYGSPGGNIRLGLKSGYTIKTRCTILLDGGLCSVLKQKQSIGSASVLGYIPIYSSFIVAYHF